MPILIKPFMKNLKKFLMVEREERTRINAKKKLIIIVNNNERKRKNKANIRGKTKINVIIPHTFQTSPLLTLGLFFPHQKSMDTDRCTAFSWRESRWLVVGTSSRSSSRSHPLSAASCE